MGKEPTPLEKVTKDADQLRKQVDKIVKESVKNAGNKKLKDREVKLKTNFKSCYDIQPQVTELLQRAEDLSEENETKPKNFETKKKKEVDRITTWQTQLDDAMSKLLPDEEGENYKKELKKEAGGEEEEDEKGAKEEEEEEEVEEEEEEEDEEAGTTMGETGKESDEEEVEEEEVEEEEVEEDDEEEEEEEEEDEEEEEVEEETVAKKVVETKSTPRKAAKKPQVEEEEEEEEEDDDEEEEEDDDEEEDEEEEDDEEEEGEKTDMEVTTTGRLFEALYDYDGQEEEDLSFKKGEILTIMNTREDGWWEAENDKGVKGNVPSTYLQMYNKYKDVQQEDEDKEDEEEEDAEEEEEEDDDADATKDKKKPKKKRSLDRTSVTDVLHAMGAVPSGFRISTLAQKFNTDSTYTMKNYLVPKLSASNLSYKDLMFDPSINKIKGRLSRDQRMITLTSCRQIPVPEGGLEVTSRHVRICLFDGQNILSNIHTVKVGSVDRDQRTWSFNTKVSDLMDTYPHAEVFYRTNSVGASIGVLFELCASYFRPSTKERGEFSCGWSHLALEDSITGLPIQNKTYDLYVHGGTIYEKGVEVDPSISRRTSTNALMSLISGNKQPRLIIKLSVPKKEQKELMDTLPDTLIGNASLLQMYSYYRQLLADTLLRDRLDLESTDAIHSPVLATFPLIADQHDMMKLLRDTWIETVRGIRRADMRDEEFMKDTFKKVVMESVYPLYNSATLRDYKSGAAIIEQARQDEIDRFRQQKLNKRGILALLLSADMTHLPVDMKEISFNVINPYCLPQQTNTHVTVQS